jgi:hypothetical protein
MTDDEQPKVGSIYRIKIGNWGETFEGILREIKYTNGQTAEIRLENGIKYFRMDKQHFDQVSLNGIVSELEQIDNEERFYRTRSIVRGDIGFDVC